VDIYDGIYFNYHHVYVCAHVCTILNWVQSVNFVLLLRSMCLVCWCWSGNECVVWYTRCNVQKLVNKVVLQNMMHSAYDIKIAYSNEVMYVSTLWTGDADLRFYVTTVQDG